jgi:hypothetical protein
MAQRIDRQAVMGGATAAGKNHRVQQRHLRRNLAPEVNARLISGAHWLAAG